MLGYYRHQVPVIQTSRARYCHPLECLILQDVQYYITVLWVSSLHFIVYHWEGTPGTHLSFRSGNKTLWERTLCRINQILWGSNEKMQGHLFWWQPSRSHNICFWFSWIFLTKSIFMDLFQFLEKCPVTCQIFNKSFASLIRKAHDVPHHLWPFESRLRATFATSWCYGIGFYKLVQLPAKRSHIFAHLSKRLCESVNAFHWSKWGHFWNLYN